MNIPSNITTLIAGVLLTLISLWYGQNHHLLPEAASDSAPLVDGLFNTMMTVAVGLFLIVQGAIIISIFKFRRRQGDTGDGPPIHGSIPLEILWTAIPAVIVLGISVYSFEVYKTMGGLDPKVAHDYPYQENQEQMASLPGAAIAATLPAESSEDQLALGVGAPPEREGQSASLTVDVLALQYGWIFTYPNSNSPDDDVVAGELYLPMNREVEIRITAQDVLHAFWIPQFRLKQDAIPGRTTTLRFTPTQVGEYPLICAELCGPYHGAMKAQVIVQSAEEFDQWLEEQLALASTRDTLSTGAVANQEPPVSQLLTHHGHEMGIDPATLAQIPHEHHHH